MQVNSTKTTLQNASTSELPELHASRAAAGDTEEGSQLSSEPLIDLRPGSSRSTHKHDIKSSTTLHEAGHASFDCGQFAMHSVVNSLVNFDRGLDALPICIYCMCSDLQHSLFEMPSMN